MNIRDKILNYIRAEMEFEGEDFPKEQLLTELEKMSDDELQDLTGLQGALSR